MGEPPRRPYAFDFVSLQGEDDTRIHPFFAHLKEGRLTTTKCGRCDAVHWQPRVVCPHCHHDEMGWVDLPTEGTVFAHTAVVHGAPLGMEDDTPFVVALVCLKDTDILVTARIDDVAYEDLAIGDAVRLKVVPLEDGRVWFRFVPSRAASAAAE